MGLPYERQILRLLQELSHYQVVVRHCRQEKAKYTEELEKTCREIEQAVYEMEEKQQTVLSENLFIADGSDIMSYLRDHQEQIPGYNIKELQKIKKEHLFGLKIHGIIELVDKIKCFVHSLKWNRCAEIWILIQIRTAWISESV